MNILSADNLHILSQRNEKLHSMWTITIDDHTCHDEVLLMIQRAFMTPTHLLRSCSMIIHCQQSRTCVCVWDRLAVFCAIRLPLWKILFWSGQSVKGTKAPLVCRTWQRKSAPIRRFRLCQPYVITPGFFPCRHHAMSKTIRMGSQVAWDRATSGTWRPCWHVTSCDVLTFSFCEHHRATNPGGRNMQKWLRVACLTPAEILSSFVRQSPGCRFGAFWVCGMRISVMQGVTASVLFSCTFCIRIRNLIRSA